MIDLVENNRKNIEALCRQHHVKNLYVFGSAVNGDFTNNSDIDLLYEFDFTGFDFKDLRNAPYDPFWFFFDLRQSLEDIFKRKVDLIPYQDFKNSYFKAEVEKTKQLLYGAERN